KNDLDFYFKYYHKHHNSKLLVFSNGAYDPKISKPPVFMRSKWHEDFDANCLFIDDRTVHGNRLRIGWGVGSKERHYLVDYVEVVKKISEIISVEANNIIYFGSSAGGFMSMAMATMHKGTK